jgi:hypothetical protein
MQVQFHPTSIGAFASVPLEVIDHIACFLPFRDVVSLAGTNSYLRREVLQRVELLKVLIPSHFRSQTPDENLWNLFIRLAIPHPQFESALQLDPSVTPAAPLLYQRDIEISQHNTNEGCRIWFCIKGETNVKYMILDLKYHKNPHNLPPPPIIHVRPGNQSQTFYLENPAGKLFFVNTLTGECKSILKKEDGIRSWCMTADNIHFFLLGHTTLTIFSQISSEQSNQFSFIIGSIRDHCFEELAQSLPIAEIQVGHKIHCFIPSSDGKKLLLGCEIGRTGVICTIDITSKKLKVLYHENAAGKGPMDMQLFSDQQHAAVLWASGLIQIIDLLTNKITRSFHLIPEEDRDNHYLDRLQISADDRTLIIGEDYGPIIGENYGPLIIQPLDGEMRLLQISDYQSDLVDRHFNNLVLSPDNLMAFSGAINLKGELSTFIWHLYPSPESYISAIDKAARAALISETPKKCFKELFDYNLPPSLQQEYKQLAFSTPSEQSASSDLPILQLIRSLSDPSPEGSQLYPEGNQLEEESPFLTSVSIPAELFAQLSGNPLEDTDSDDDASVE